MCSAGCSVQKCKIPLSTLRPPQIATVTDPFSTRIRYASRSRALRRAGAGRRVARGATSDACETDIWQVHSRASRGGRGAVRDRRAPDGSLACCAPTPARRMARGRRTRARCFRRKRSEAPSNYFSSPLLCLLCDCCCCTISVGVVMVAQFFFFFFCCSRDRRGVRCGWHERIGCVVLVRRRVFPCEAP